jgi:formate C-acetyltransferase
LRWKNNDGFSTCGAANQQGKKQMNTKLKKRDFDPLIQEPKPQWQQRLERLMGNLNPREFPICVEKARLVIESYKKNEGRPQIIRKALAIENFLQNRTIFIEDDALIVGNVASKPNGMEAGPHGPTWPAEDFQSLIKSGYTITPPEEAELRALDEYWLGKGRTFYERMGEAYDDDRLWPFIQSGLMLPPWTRRDEGRGHGITDFGWGLTLGYSLIVVDFEKVLSKGLNAIIAKPAQN